MPAETPDFAKVRKRLERLGEAADPQHVAEVVQWLRETKEEPAPVTGITRTNFRAVAVAPLTIVTDGTSNYYVKVLDATTQRTLLTAFIRRGDTRLVTKVPPGTCLIRYAAGEHWFGEPLDFGLGLRGPVSYSLCDDRFDFHETPDAVFGYTIELFLHFDGNLKTLPIEPENF